ncbi:MAG: HAMP domain-containing sensor histidine kinase, partial [Phycisphaerales bacterium]|nr:HAMP domain-containing sensor histidine kinase [Phycisphaerales bacterium]
YVQVELRSPRAPSGRNDDWRPYEWIDLFFQVDSHGKLSSPQIPDDADHPPSLGGVDPRTRYTWEWLQTVLPATQFPQLLAEARERDQGGSDDRIDEPSRLVKMMAMSNAKTGPARTSGRTHALRQGSLLEAQAGYIPREQCVDPQVVARNIPGNRTPPLNTTDDASLPPGGVSMSHSAIAPPFWLQPGPDGHRKLAFVREVFADAEVVYQGFIGDWERLKPELLSRICRIFPDADLVPVADDPPNTADADETSLQQLPVMLSIPEIAGGMPAAAWRSIRGMLLISWTATLAVLVVAGWGVMNLVALTERRMQFAYAVTHELRTPLTTFRLYSDMLSAGLVPPEKQQEYLDTLNRESARLSKMVESVLEYARLENRQVRLHLRDTDGASLLQTVGETLDKRCGENGIEGRKVNQMTNGQSIRTDVELVSQITGVLINNACRHARSSKKPVVMLHLGGDNGRVYVDVVDSGAGVDLTDSRRIFKPFRRGRDADTAARGGVGLGLALARDWASLLGGRLDLIHRHDPQLGGAHFRLTIPAQAI